MRIKIINGIGILTIVMSILGIAVDIDYVNLLIYLISNSVVLVFLMRYEVREKSIKRGRDIYVN